jgi:tetratricopeptide (TPR) repeat protein
MSEKTIKSALGLLQDDSENPQAWADLRDQVLRDPGMSHGDLAKLLEAARRAHEARREYEAVAEMLAIEAVAASGTPQEAELLGELARVLDEELLDDAGALAVYEKLAVLRPGDALAAEAAERSEAKRAKWAELVERYVQEVARAADPAFKSSLLVRAAEVLSRYGRGDPKGNAVERGVELLREALLLQPHNLRAEILLERVLRDASRWDDLARAIESFATESKQKDEKVAAWVRLARTLAKRLDSSERAAAAYERVIDLAPGQPQATGFLVDHFTSHKMWEHLVALYEEQLAAGGLRTKDEVFGATLQVAMVHWRMRGRPDAAEPWFDKLRKLEPANGGMLSFFREWCSTRGDTTRLMGILVEAQRSLPEGRERAAVGGEIARLAEEGANAQKAIDQWRSLLRQDPQNVEARDALKRLYRQTASWNALADLLRQELDRLSTDDVGGRLATLREIAAIYRENIKSDSALVTILSQVVQLDPNDLSSVRDLVRVYEGLQRWRDLLVMQARQAELEPESSVKAELWRTVARRWFEQFSNVQNAVEAYEKLHGAAPGDLEAVERLKELYGKRRAYKPLYDLLDGQAKQMPAGTARREVWTEMAKLAAERLDMGPGALDLYRRVLDEDPSSVAVVDALEKQAERDKDFGTVAEALERRAVLATDNATRLAVLQKLGSVYSDRLGDPAKAASAWKRVLEAQPGHPKALRVLRDSHLATGDYDGLVDLYAQSGDWEGLVEVLSGAADKATDPDLKIDLSLRSARIYEGKLNAPERAFRAYERVLSVHPEDARAASALVPLYEKDEKWGRLPALYEALLGKATDVAEKLTLLDKLVQVTGHQLQDRVAAFKWATKAYELTPDRPGALEALEEAARASGQWEGFVEAIRARLATFEPSAAGAARPKKKKKRDENGGPARSAEGRRLLRGKLAQVLGREMARVDDAIETYRALIEEDDTDEAAVQSLDRLLRETDRTDDLRWLFELRVERANTALKIDLLSEWALLEEEAFGSPERAIALYKRLLQVVPHHGAALRALARLLRSHGDALGAAEVLAVDRDQREGEERASREIEIAKLYAEALGKHAEALAACERALQLSPNDPRAMAVVEQLLPIAETRGRAAAILERSYDETGAAQKQTEVLEVLIGTTAAKNDRLALYNRLADVYERKLEDPRGAFEVMARAAAESPAELAVWDRLAGLAARTNRVQALIDAIEAVVPPTGAATVSEAVELDLAERAATLFDERLGDVERARPYLERMLVRQPGNERAFQRMKQILTAQERWDDLSALYERVVAATADPSRRTELLAEVAVVAEEITGDRAKAIEYYERILELDPLHESAIRSLDALYAAQQHFDRLARLLERWLQHAEGDSRLDLQLRLGILLFSRLGDAGAALSYLEQVLREKPSATEARQIVEKILDIPELRSRAAIVLEAVYADRDEVDDLVRVLEIHLEFAAGSDERRDILRRVAQLRDERLRDDAGALEAFGRLLPLDPDDAVARTRMLEIAKRLAAHERVAGVLTATAAAAEAPLPRAEILMDLARLHENQLGDASRAEAAYRQVLQLAPTDASIALPACRALDRLYLRGDGRQLREILEVEIELEDDVETKRLLQARLGELCEVALGDLVGAIAPWRKRLDDDVGDIEALAALDRLYERTQKWRELVEILRARERQVADPSARRVLLGRIATTLADRLADIDEAILAYRAVIEEFGADRGSLSSLAMLYETADRWGELADTLEADLGLTESAADKLAVLARLGEVRHRKLADVAGAIEAYSQALTIDASHPACRAALEAMLEEPTARREAAAILRPLYENDGQHEKLLRVLEIGVECADSVTDRLAMLAQAARVAEDQLGDPGRAFSYVARGLREAVAEPDLPRWIEHAERLASASGKHVELVGLLRSAVDEMVDGDLQLEVVLRIADVSRSRLGETALAKEYYARALDLRGDDGRALEALESLYEETEDFASLLEIVRRRADGAATEDGRKALLFKQARICDEKLGDARAAIGVYEEILDLGADAQAVQALERLYALAEQWEHLVSLYERQIGAPGASNERKAALHHALGAVVEKRTGDVDRAFDEYATALSLDPRHPQTVASLEALMAQRPNAARAAMMLEPVYLARLDWRRVMATLEARLDVSQEPDERRGILRRLSKLREEQEENYGAALETAAKLLGEDVTDESTWAELERLARVANAESRLAEIYAVALEHIAVDEPTTAKLAHRTGELLEAGGDSERALSFYRRSYGFDPQQGGESFAAIDRLLTAAGRSSARVDLYRDALDYKHDPAERLGVLHTIARLQEKELRDPSGAIETYRVALDVDDTDAVSLDALSGLYSRSERWHDLAELIRRRAEQSVVPDEQARFRFELANLLIGRLGETSAGIDELQAVVELASPNPEGVGAHVVDALEPLLRITEQKARIIDILRPIYEKWDAWQRLVALNDERLSIATDSAERVAILRESASLWEDRGRDARRAFDAMAAAWTLDPDDGHAREQLERLAGVTERWDDLGEAYEVAISKTEGLTRREILTALARLHDRRRDDPRRALDAYERLFAVDETDIEPLDAMEPLATLLSDWSTLVRVLTRKADLLGDDETRASTWRRIGEAKRDMLDDPDGAVMAYERALELEPTSALTLDYLLDLLESKRGSSRTAELYRRRIELCGEDESALRFDLLVRASKHFERDLANRAEAIECLVQALLIRPEDSDALARLGVLYAEERLWPELLDNLKAQTQLTADVATRVALKKRIASLYAVELQDPQAALDAYRDVLASGFDAEAVAAIRAIGETRDDLRGDAADALEPVLRAAGHHADVVAVLELRLRVQSDPEQRARTLRAVADVAERSLGDIDRAHSVLIRALAEEPHDPALHAELERLAERLGRLGWERYADALQERAGAIFDASLGADLFSRLGRIAEEKLDDSKRAADAYQAAAERTGDDRAVLSALDRLLVRLGDSRRLADVLERRVAVESDPRPQAELLYRLGDLQIREFKQKAQGLATLRQALERAPDEPGSLRAVTILLEDEALFDDAFDTLSTAYRALGNGAEVAKLYELRVERASTVRDRIQARLDLARALEELTSDRRGAQRAVEAALQEDPNDSDSMSALERLAEANGEWASAAEALATALAANQDAPAITRSELWVRLAGWRLAKLGDGGRAEEAFERALALDPENLTILRVLETIRQAPGRERDLVRTLRALASLEPDIATKRDLLRKAKSIAEVSLGDRGLAEEALRDLIAEDEGDIWAYEELTKIRDTAGDDAEVVRLLLRRSELADNGATAVALKHEAARVLESKLSDEKRATALLEEILDSDPEDARAAAALRALYGKAGRDKDLARLLVRLVEVVASQEARTELRLDLARLQAERFRAPVDAIETLRLILEEDPTHPGAVLALTQLYEQTGRDADLAELVKAQLDAARSAGNVSAEIALLVRLGEMSEARLGDLTAAQEAYEQVLERDPAHQATLEALARIAEHRSDWERAATALAKLLTLSTGPGGVAIALKLADAREKLGDAPGAEAALQQGLALEPANADLRSMLRARWERSGRWSELADLLIGDADLIAAANPDVQAATQEPRVAVAPPMQNSSLAPAPVVPLAITQQVKLLRAAADIQMTRQSAPDRAVATLERAARLVPHDRELLLALGDAYGAAGRGREAAQVLERVIASFGNRRTKELAVYHHRLGRALSQLGDRDLAFAQFDMAFKIDPGSVAVLRDLGALAFEANDFERAQKTYRALLLQRLDADAGITKAEVFFYLGEISAKLGDRPKAVQMFERSIENDPSMDRARARLAELKG